MEIKKLNTVSFDHLMDCFLSAFENYFVQMPTDREYYKTRWKAAGVDFNLSYGMFDDGKMVGFIINAIGERNDDRIAFNTGTGVLPEYRGRKIVQSIYDFAIPDLKSNGITKCALEVITKNEIAIKSYQRIGFEICKTYKCFGGEIKVQPDSSFELLKTNYSDLDFENLPHQNLYSWDNNSKAIKDNSYDYFQVMHENALESYFIINSTNGYIAQLEVLNAEDNVWKRLFIAVQSVAPKIRINNVDDSLTNKIEWLLKIGLENNVDQYEMELKV
jgi:ribosomal protein S18 acetylase RimI-like enzyme